MPVACWHRVQAMGILHCTEKGRCAQVVVRIRPLNARELGMGDTEVVTVSEEDVQNILVGVPYWGPACTLVERR